MSKQEYDNQKIVEYLLGSLPDAEAERFDERSFIDGDFADALKIAEKDLIDAYVQGELTSDMLEKFKTYYLASPLRREKVRFAESFQAYAAKEQAKTDTRSAIVEETNGEKDVGFFPFISGLFGSMSPLRWGFAAVSLILVTVGGFWLLGGNHPQYQGGVNIVRQQTPAAASNQESPKPTSEQAAILPQETPAANKETELAQQKNATDQGKKPQNTKTPEIPKPQPSPNIPKISVASFILTPPLRSSSQLPSLAIPAQTDEVAIRLEIEADDYPNYQVNLTDQSGKQLWNSGARLKAGSAGDKKVISVRFPANLLKSQVFSLVVSGVQRGSGEAEIISNYPFRAVLK